MTKIGATQSGCQNFYHQNQCGPFGASHRQHSPFQRLCGICGRLTLLRLRSINNGMSFTLGGKWLPGNIIPSEMQLAQELDVSQGTVRKAIIELVEKKVCVRIIVLMSNFAQWRLQNRMHLY